MRTHYQPIPEIPSKFSSTALHSRATPPDCFSVWRLSHKIFGVIETESTLPAKNLHKILKSQIGEKKNAQDAVSTDNRMVVTRGKVGRREVEEGRGGQCVVTEGD